ncbi:thioesterase superfamily protein [Viridothelium virens]|uniref:Thioesterase superfamily protein n=1 Tax=Viridothelium virens TaxID=1048519 RepID=A0A6A6HNU5_VIRVR|nr:thioesterase superfamily protein [Viridothelium virens]
MTFEADLQHLQTIAWCRRLIEDPNMTVFPFTSRNLKLDSEDTFFNKTLNTEDTIKHAVCLHRKATPGAQYVEEVLSLMTLGGLLNGQPHIIHGGMLATILDEVSGFLFVVNKDLGKAPGRGYSVTAYLNVSFLKAVASQQTILVAARLTNVTGKKRFVDCEIRDGDGNVLAKSEALFVATREAKL